LSETNPLPLGDLLDTANSVFSRNSNKDAPALAKMPIAVHRDAGPGCFKHPHPIPELRIGLVDFQVWIPIVRDHGEDWLNSAPGDDREETLPIAEGQRQRSSKRMDQILSGF